MKITVLPAAGFGLCGLLSAFCVAGHVHADPVLIIPGMTIAVDSTGLMGTYKIDGPIDKHTEFFQSLGSNGRSCSTCHIAEQAMSFTPTHARRLYEQSRGADPLFASVDAAFAGPGAQQNSCIVLLHSVNWSR
jgi:hypothetical protein